MAVLHRFPTGTVGVERPAQHIGLGLWGLYPPSALFAVAFGVVLVLLIHFSLAVSRLSDQNKVLAQRIGLMQQQLDELDVDADATSSDRPSDAESERVHQSVS